MKKIIYKVLDKKKHRCGVYITPVASFKKRKCGKKAILLLSDISGKSFGTLTDLYMCSEHANKVMMSILKLNPPPQRGMKGKGVWQITEWF